MKLAANISDIFGGRISPPPGVVGGGNPATEFGNILAFALKVVFVIAALLVLAYGLWGGIDWITSGGDKEKLQKAVGKIRDAFIGIIVLIAVLTIFFVIAGQMLGIIDTSNGIQFTLPRL